MKKKHTYLSEILLLFLLIDAVNIVFFPNDLGFLKYELNPYWIPILLTASRYGVMAGLLSGAIAALQMLYFLFGYLPGRTEIEIETESTGLALPLAFLLVGGLLGGIRQRYRREEEKLEQRFERQKATREAVQQRYEASEEARQAIESKIVGQTATIRTLYDVSRKLDVTGSDQEILDGGLTLLKDHFDVTRASAWLFREEAFYLTASEGWLEGERVEGKRLAGEGVLGTAFRQDQMITLHALHEKQGEEFWPTGFGLVAAIPLKSGNDKPIGVVLIEKMGFMQLTESNLELVELIVQWMARSLQTHQEIEQLRSHALWDRRLEIYSAQYLHEALDRDFRHARAVGGMLCLALAQVEHYALLSPETRDLVARAVIASIRRHLESQDVCFQYDLDGVFAVMSSTSDLAGLSSRLALVQRDLEEATRSRQTHLADELYRYSPYLVVGCAQITDDMRSGVDLEKRVLRTLDIDMGCGWLLEKGRT